MYSFTEHGGVLPRICIVCHLCCWKLGCVYIQVLISTGEKHEDTNAALKFYTNKFQEVENEPFTFYYKSPKTGKNIRRTVNLGHRYEADHSKRYNCICVEVDRFFLVIISIFNMWWTLLLGTLFQLSRDILFTS